MKPRAERKNKWTWLLTNVDARYLNVAFFFFWMFIKIWIVVLGILSQLSKDYLFLPLILRSNGEIELPVFQKVISYWLLVSPLYTNICSKFLCVSHDLGSQEWQLCGERSAWAVRKVPGAPSPVSGLGSAEIWLIERYVLGAGGAVKFKFTVFSRVPAHT